MFIMKLIGDNLRKLRKSFGLTQKEFGEKTRTSRETINRIENNKLNPTTELIYQICHCMDVEVGRVLSEPKEKRR